jgi:phage terminase large subunit-like protein
MNRAARTANRGSRFPECGHTFDGRTCHLRGAHFCRPRANHVVRFFAELLVHTVGEFARQPFVLSPWERRELIEPLFGRVVWDAKRQRYVRQYRELYLLVARKNGKSELLAGICLFLLAGEGEQAAEIYGLALDKDQAGHVYRRAARMVELSPTLARRLEVLRATGRVVDAHTSSFLTVAAGDAAGGLGATPQGVYIDELLTQPSRELYDAMRTGFGTRAQPLLMMATTAEADSSGFAAQVREESLLIKADPSRNPQRLVLIYQVAADEDWAKESNWRKANPALGDFLDIEVLRAEFRRAELNPTEERAFRQFRLNQPVRAVGRAIDLRAWDRAAGLVVEEHLQGQRCHGGLDLATTTDLAALAWDFPEEDEHQVIWRLWCPEAALDGFNRVTAGAAGVWARQGFLTVTEGNVIDYQVIRRQIGTDAERFDVVDVAYDRWGATQLVQELTDDGLTMVDMGQGFASMSAPTKELFRLVLSGRYHHGGNPAVRWQAEHVVTRTDPAGNLKVDKARSVEKVDGIVAGVMALDRAMRHTNEQRRQYRSASF